MELGEEEIKILIMIVGTVSAYLFGQGFADAGEKLGKFLKAMGEKPNN